MSGINAEIAAVVQDVHIRTEQQAVIEAMLAARVVDGYGRPEDWPDLRSRDGAATVVGV